MHGSKNSARVGVTVSAAMRQDDRERRRSDILFWRRAPVIPKLSHLAPQAIEIGVDNRFGHSAIPQLLPHLRTGGSRNGDDRYLGVGFPEFVCEPVRVRPEHNEAATLCRDPLQ